MCGSICVHVLYARVRMADVCGGHVHRPHRTTNVTNKTCIHA